MTITQLEYFLAVANYGSFSVAAQNCFVTQPSLSMQISNLEDELGVILLDRGSKPIAPTEAGIVVLERAKEAVAAFYSTKEGLNDLKGGLSGKLRLGVIPTICPYLMPKFVPEFVKKYPKVELEIRDVMTSDIIDALNRDIIDIAIFAGREPLKIKEIKLFEEKLYFYVSPRNELYGRSSIAVEDVDVTKLHMLTEGNSVRNPVLRPMYLARKKAKLPYSFANCSFDTLMRMVDSTSGLTVIPGMVVDYIPEEHRKQLIPFKTRVHRRVMMAVGRTYVKSSLAEAVRETVIAVSKKSVAEFLI